MFGGQPELALSLMLQNAVELHSPKNASGCLGEQALVSPFTRAALNDKKVRHEIVLNEDGEADENIDPAIQVSRSAHSE
jgi:hypothetical protein